MSDQTLTPSQVEEIPQTFPQELVDHVIDELVTLKNGSTNPVAAYSLVSRAWVTRTQKHHFDWIYFDGWDSLHKWHGSIVPDPDGVSRHANYLMFVGINSLPDGLEVYIRVFTCVENVKITGCNCPPPYDPTP